MDLNATNGIGPLIDPAMPTGRQPNLVTNTEVFPSMEERAVLNKLVSMMLCTSFANGHRYYTLVHPTWPILPDDVEKLRYAATYCNEKQREALFMAIETMTVAPVSGPLQGASRLAKATDALEAYNKSKFKNFKSRHYATNVNHLYTLACLVVAFESLGDLRVASAHAPSTGPLYAEARDIFTHLKVNEGKKPMLGDEELSRELFVAARRIWWVLVTLDTLKALGESSKPFFAKPLHFVAEDVGTDTPVYQLGRKYTPWAFRTGPLIITCEQVSVAPSIAFSVTLTMSKAVNQLFCIILATMWIISLTSPKAPRLHLDLW